MTKSGRKKDPIEKARRKLARAQLDLSAAQERHAEARIRGKQEIERARLQAAKWQAKAAERVERRAEKVARAEANLLSLSSNADIEPMPAGSMHSPDGVADRLEMIETQGDSDESPIVVPDEAGGTAPRHRKRQSAEGGTTAS